MKPPKNFYSNLDRRKQGLPEVPEASAADAGKVIKVGSDGSYGLGADTGLPTENIPTNLGMLITRNSSWIMTQAVNDRIMSFANNIPNYIKSFGIYIDSTGIKFNNINSSLSAVMSYCDDTCMMPVTVVKNDICYQGFYISKSSDDITFFTINTVDQKPYQITYDGTNISISPIGSTHKFIISIVGSTVVLPQGCDYTLLSSLILSGVEVILTNDSSFYRLSEIDSNLKLVFNCIASSNDSVKVYQITIATDSTATHRIVEAGGVAYFEITASGSSVSLPSGVTFADIYALLQAGVDIKFTSGARVYSVTSFESTNIRAHWMSDLDLTSMEVYVINLASDGTGTVASATFSGF